MVSTLTTQELDQLGCFEPDCDNTACDGEVFFHSACHTGEPTWVRYDSKTQTVTVTCAVCSQHICSIKVASGS